MNDPNGPIFYKGFYHLFYQLNPFSDGDGPKYWGHVRSRDLAKWEPLPIALWPSTETGESGVWSGCCTINGQGQPMIFYTSAKEGKSAFDTSEQWAAIDDDDLIHWQKSPANPVLSEAVNGNTKIYDWRDPFVFREGKKTFLVAGGHLQKEGHAAVNIYEAQNSDLTKWVYRGVLFELPDPKTPTAECPNFFKLDDRWVLFVSPYGHVQYFVGDFDAATCRFHARTNGTVDFGSFYAPNTMQLADGRRIVWGWVNGFPGGHGWNGCLSVPRALSLSHDGRLLQTPAPELQKLRGQEVNWHNLELNKGEHSLVLPKTNTLEIQAEISRGKNGILQVRLKSEGQDSPAVVVTWGASQLQVRDVEAPLQIDGAKKLMLHIFIDRSVLEVFGDDGTCVTEVIPPLDGNPVLELDAYGAPVTVRRLQAWPIKTIW
jgi:beta-fructofuranosidase